MGCYTICMILHILELLVVASLNGKHAKKYTRIYLTT